MRIGIAGAMFLLLNPLISFGQSKSNPTHAASNPFGMSCTEILKMTSSEWIAKVASAEDSSEEGQLRAIESYGKCYDERTNRLAAALGRRGKGPLMGARGDFGDFMSAVDDFTATALADTQPLGDAVKKAYAALYEKQFRYEFYESYEEKAAGPKRAPVAPAETAPAATPQPGGAANAPVASKGKSAEPVSEMTRAKNRFGELLDDLPPDKLHEVHAAFAKVVENQPLGYSQELAIYRYAIFVLEPPARPGAATNGTMNMRAAKPFAPPPF